MRFWSTSCFQLVILQWDRKVEGSGENSTTNVQWEKKGNARRIWLMSGLENTRIVNYDEWNSQTSSRDFSLSELRTAPDLL